MRADQRVEAGHEARPRRSAHAPARAARRAGGSARRSASGRRCAGRSPPPPRRAQRRRRSGPSPASDSASEQIGVSEFIISWARMRVRSRQASCSTASRSPARLCRAISRARPGRRGERAHRGQRPAPVRQGQHQPRAQRRGGQLRAGGRAERGQGAQRRRLAEPLGRGAVGELDAAVLSRRPARRRPRCRSAPAGSRAGAGARRAGPPGSPSARSIAAPSRPAPPLRPGRS